MSQRQAAQLLQTASRRAVAALKEAGFTQGMIENGTGLGRSVLAKVGTDPPSSGWRAPSAPTCAAIDRFCLTRLGHDFDLVGLRTTYERLGGGHRGPGQNDPAALGVYLQTLREVLTAAPAWTPFASISDGFQSRMVRAGLHPPRTSEETGSTGVRRGDVPWDEALIGASFVVVLADAGYGKSWQSRAHAARLASAALVAVNDVPVPLWLHAADLAKAWGQRTPVEALVMAADSVLARAGVETSATQDALLALLDRDEGDVAVIVDAYDEVIGPQARASIRAALDWLTIWVRGKPGRSLLLTSRRAGFDDPVRVDGDVTGRNAPVYVELGGLDEAQIRRLWSQWFDRRGQPVPWERLTRVLAPGSGVRQFARIPLIAAFCAWVAERDDVADSRSALFGQVVQRFLARAWKGQDDAAGALFDSDDGARRAQLLAALSELAWVMVIDGDGVHSIPVDTCERVLARLGPSAAAGHSLVFEAVRGSGILTQGGVDRGATLGDGPIEWVHRSVQEFLAAAHLAAQSSQSIERFVRDSWCRPSAATVLDFALGSGHRSVRDAVHTVVIDGDPLGYYATMLAAARQATERDTQTLIAMFGAGLVSAQTLASALMISGADEQSSALLPVFLAELAPPGVTPDRESLAALARCGAAGRQYVATLVAGDAHATGASSELFDVDAELAVAAVEARVADGLAVGTGDARCLREVGPTTRKTLRDAVRSNPSGQAAARALGLTRSSEARELLSANLVSDDARVRHAAAHGISSWYGNGLTAEGFAVLSKLARSDPDRSVRLAVRGALYAVGLSVPWVSHALDDQFESLNSDARDSHTGPSVVSDAVGLPFADGDRHPIRRPLEVLAQRLWPVGPSTHVAVAMLAEEPRLWNSLMDEPLRRLADLTLAGGVDVSLTADVFRLIGQPLVDLAKGILISQHALTATERDNLTVGLALARPDDTDVFGLLIEVHGREPSLLLEAALTASTLAAATRIELIALAELALDARARVAVRAWTELIVRLLVSCTQGERKSLQPLLLSATSHVLTLS